MSGGKFEGSLEGSLHFTSFIQLILKDASSVSVTSFNNTQLRVHYGMDFGDEGLMLSIVLL